MIQILKISLFLTLCGVILAYNSRGYFAVGGEWLIPILVFTGWQVLKEIKSYE